LRETKNKEYRGELVEKKTKKKKKRDWVEKGYEGGAKGRTSGQIPLGVSASS